MFISESDSEEIKPEVSKILKTLGIKHRIKKFDDKMVSKNFVLIRYIYLLRFI